eukprot:5794100-Lingulodinium_polyedra.AAC.1
MWNHPRSPYLIQTDPFGGCTGVPPGEKGPPAFADAGPELPDPAWHPRPPNCLERIEAPWAHA